MALGDVTDAMALVVGHDSTITVVYPSGPDSPPQAIYSVQLPSLPCISLLFITETSIVAAGHDCRPILFAGDVSAGWSEIKSLDDASAKGAESRTGGVASGTVGRLNQSEAFNMFRQADSRGVASGASSPTASGAGTRMTSNGTELLTIHQNTITSVRAFAGETDQVQKLSTTGVDGRLVIWDISNVDTLTAAVDRLNV